jgi:hypothetical protein
MTRAKFDYPDLDVPDSPLISSTPFTSFLSGLPGSAIAENIFNDPDSWEENNDPEDPLAWLVEGIEKFKVNSAEVYGAFDHDKKNPGLTSPAVGMQLGSGLKGINKASDVRPISIPCFFESADDDDIQDQLSKILDVSGIPHQIRPLSSPLTPPSSSKINYPLNINSTSNIVGSTVDSASPVVASITMSFLGWYGVYPESELDLRSLRQQYRKSINTKCMPVIPSPSPAPSGDTFSHPPTERVSPIPPPGLESPPHLPRSRSSAPIPPSPPPPYSRTRSPAGSRPQSESKSRSNSRSQSPTSTSAQDTSSRDSNIPTRRRRLPSVPPEASPPTSRSSPVLPSPELPALASQQQESPISRLRPLSSVRSLLVGPAGPRMRVSSRRSSQDSISREPPVPLRF